VEHKIVGRVYGVLIEREDGEVRLAQPVRGDETLEQMWDDARRVKMLGADRSDVMLLGAPPPPPLV
jgi:hypothetical protein